MAIKNSVSNYFLSTLVDSINIFDCPLYSVFQEYVMIIDIKNDFT